MSYETIQQMEKLVYKPVSMRTRMPLKAGWFNIVANSSPKECGRAFFDGDRFNLNNKCHEWSGLLASGHDIYWLEQQE